MTFTPVNKVLNDQKVTVIAHFVQDAKLHVKSLNLLGSQPGPNLFYCVLVRLLSGHIKIAKSHTMINQFVQVLFLRLAVRGREFRDQYTAKINLDITSIRNLSSIRHGFWVLVRPSSNHIFWIGDMQMKISQRHTLLIRHKRSSTNTEQNLMRLLILSIYIVSIATNNCLDPQLLRQLE